MGMAFMLGYLCVVQMMLLSSLGMKLLVEIQHFFRWAKKLIRLLGNVIIVLAHKLVECDKGILLIMIVGIILLGIRFGNQIRAKGVNGVIENEALLWKNVQFLLIYSCIGLLLYVAPTFFIGFKKTIARIGQAALKRLADGLGNTIPKHGKRGRGNKEDGKEKFITDKVVTEVVEHSEATESLKAIETEKTIESSRVEETAAHSEVAETEETAAPREVAEAVEPPESAERKKIVETEDKRGSLLKRIGINPMDLKIALVCYLVLLPVFAFAVALCSPEGHAVLAENGILDFNAYVEIMKLAIEIVYTK